MGRPHLSLQNKQPTNQCFTMGGRSFTPTEVDVACDSLSETGQRPSTASNHLASVASSALVSADIFTRFCYVPPHSNSRHIQPKHTPPDWGPHRFHPNLPVHPPPQIKQHQTCSTTVLSPYFSTKKDPIK